DERDMAPRRGAERSRVVVGRAEQVEPVVRNAVPLLARHLARLAPDADGGVGEETDSGLSAQCESPSRRSLRSGGASIRAQARWRSRGSGLFARALIAWGSGSGGLSSSLFARALIAWWTGSGGLSSSLFARALIAWGSCSGRLVSSLFARALIAG